MTTPTHTTSSFNDNGPVHWSTLLLATVTLTNIPAALTDVSAAVRHSFDLRGVKFVRLSGNVTTQAANGGEVRAQYSTDDGSTFAYFDTTNSAPAVSLIGTGVKSSSWAAVPAAAQKERVVVRLISISGDAAEDPIIAQISAEFRT